MLISVWGWPVVGGQSWDGSLFLKHFQLESNINRVPGFTEGMTTSDSPSLVSFALRAKSCSMWAAFSIVNDAALLLYTNKSAALLSVAEREGIERDRDQVGHFRAARVRRTKNKSSFVSLVDDRATWHIVCFSFLDLSFRGFLAFPTHTATVTCRPHLGGDWYVVNTHVLEIHTDEHILQLKDCHSSTRFFSFYFLRRN